MTGRHVHPWVFLLLILPFGVMSGYLTVTLAWQLTHAGVTVEQVATLVALSYVPHTWKFLWAPVADSVWTRKGWYVLACVLSGAGMFAMGVLTTSGARLALLTVVVVTANVAVTFVGMAVESLLAYNCDDEEKGRAAGWFQAGNLGGNGLGGGLGLWLAQRMPEPWMPGAVLGVACLACIGGLTLLPEPPATHRGAHLGETLVNVVKDLWGVARQRVGFLALVLCFLPIGSGAASGLWSAVAGDWKASADTVALVTGVLSGIVSAAGCIVGGFVCDRMHRQWAYVLFGVLQALCAVAMALTPRTEAMFVVFTTVYAFITGLTYAGFSAFVLEAMGRGAAATKYNVFASLSNTPIAYMTRIDGWAHTRWGAGGMLFGEAIAGTVGLVLFGGTWAAAMRRRGADSLGHAHGRVRTRG
jgi:MFS family permease